MAALPGEDEAKLIPNNMHNCIKNYLDTLDSTRNAMHGVGSIRPAHSIKPENNISQDNMNHIIETPTLQETLRLLLGSLHTDNFADECSSIISASTYLKVNIYFHLQ